MSEEERPIDAAYLYVEDPSIIQDRARQLENKLKEYEEESILVLKLRILEEKILQQKGEE